ncbi:MAG: DNA replication/repair protein RecF [Anaerolineae bacterium]|nr:DNA replication/repair protein RecF [Anaerolineae bacterium]
MPLLSLEIEYLRNIAQARITLCSTLNVFTGVNASGKTTVLEAAYLLGTGRSFRTARLGRAIQAGAPLFQVRGRIEGQHGRPVELRVQRGAEGLSVAIDGRQVRGRAALAEHFPVQLIHHGSFGLLERGPEARRKFLDWGVFHVEPAYLGAWRRYHRALRQRNAWLRSRSGTGAVSPWDTELGVAAEGLDRYRASYVTELSRSVGRYAHALLGESGIELRYLRGWEASETLRDVLTGGATGDRAVGHTRSGPHRADLELRCRDVPAQERLSRGQQKLLVCALQLGQVEVFRERTGRAFTVLVDDLPAELDVLHTRRLLESLAKTQAQVLSTTVEPNALPTSAWQAHRMFHVEHGKVLEMV